MKGGLVSCPQMVDLESAYHAILFADLHPESVIDLNSFSTFCQWSRFDSRLGEICVKYLKNHWRRIHPIELHDAIASQPWPAVLGVLLGFCQNDSDLYRSWKQTATCQFKKANWEQFFIGKRRIAGQLMFDDARFALNEYRRWGYLARERLVNKSELNKPQRRGGSYSPGVRIEILREMLTHSSRITVEQYWLAIGQSISKRQAERDLKKSTFLRGKGRTKGRIYLKRR